MRFICETVPTKLPSGQNKRAIAAGSFFSLTSLHQWSVKLLIFLSEYVNNHIKITLSDNRVIRVFDNKDNDMNIIELTDNDDNVTVLL